MVHLPRCNYESVRNHDCGKPAAFVDRVSIPWHGVRSNYCNEHRGAYDTPLWCGPLSPDAGDS